jgi:hypothetical protein
MSALRPVGEVGQKRRELSAVAGGVGSGHPSVGLLEIQTALAERVVQGLDHLLALTIGGTDIGRRGDGELRVQRLGIGRGGWIGRGG